MKPLPVIVRPNRADRTLLPATLALVLALLLAFQLSLPLEVTLPDSIGRTVAPPVAEHVARRAVPDPVLAASPLFTPARAGTAQDVAANGPLAGAILVGIARGRGFARAVLQPPEGRAISLAIGQSFNGWRLIGLSSDAAQLARAGKSIAVTIGSADARGAPNTRSQLANER